MIDLSIQLLQILEQSLIRPIFLRWAVGHVRIQRWKLLIPMFRRGTARPGRGGRVQLTPTVIPVRRGHAIVDNVVQLYCNLFHRSLWFVL